jgi:hypothetical protein
LIDDNGFSILQNYNYRSFSLNINQKHICFITSFIDLNCRYLFVDSTFKSNREGFELFVIILLFHGEGYPASYLYLERRVEETQRKFAIKEW